VFARLAKTHTQEKEKERVVGGRPHTADEHRQINEKPGIAISIHVVSNVK
jgi:hypothetical protein